MTDYLKLADEAAETANCDDINDLMEPTITGDLLKRLEQAVRELSVPVSGTHVITDAELLELKKECRGPHGVVTVRASLLFALFERVHQSEKRRAKR